METIKFEELQLDERILRAVTEMGFEEASPIQAQAIPAVMEGRDIIGQAQTGTGKTAAFGIPLLQKVDPKSKKLQAIILLPTRELAIQVAEEIRRFAKFMHGIKVLPIYGGQDIVKQIRSLKDGTQIVVGTPGRVMDHMRRKTVKMDHVHTVVLDEADEMLNMGFLEDMETILSQLPQERQTLMFSATMPQAIADIAKKFQKDPVTVRVVKKELTVPKVTQYYYEVKPKNKVEVMSRLLDMYSPKLSIVFCNTKKQVDELVQALQGRGYFAEGLHGDLKQVQRDRVMDSFRNGRTDILVATDVAARGIDVGDVEAVFNYDIPQDDEYYVHRIGRTGRAGREGKAFSLVVGREVYKLRDIQRYCKTKIIPQAIPSLNDITEIKAEKVLEQVQELLNDADLTKMVNILEKKLMEEDYTSLDLAAALLKMCMGEENEDIIDSFLPARSLDDLDSFGRNGRSRGYDRDRGSRGRSSRKGATDRAAIDYVLGGGGSMARLFINIGKAQRVTPGDILGAVAGETGIPGRLVGSIDMYDGYTFVDVPCQYADDVLKAMSHAKIKGKNVHVEKANSRR
ncbi:DEAD/DEAH box helicase [Lacrimispora sp. 210928-DFI.3.58]|uniref:DEAD/DEAH box helicase n=1 Tax=Lacrimispora sp. 210928-DFI.3.58 TaxID=2883214 RepID=UPI001D060456|nr:DEAD/DEAH box helicase [Lacrimispora sp. 210928-DFI.3.58]MCB7320131.1 DEAD/DEAH box helicase [Lacrimispora sp. 210928-DFI.3.58]